MKKIFFVLSAIIVILNVSCKNSSNETGKNDKKPKTTVDSLMDDIMAGHDASMARMNKLSVFKAKIQHALDSIEALPEKAKKVSEVLKATLDSTMEKLNSAEGSMNKWMDEFNMDSLENNVAERIKYLESEKLKVSNVRDDIYNSTNKADSLLKKLIRQ
jgi:predicted  nucleic acid-binding Zn-ribbon protein